MGAVSIDLEAKERRLETQFPMHTRDGIETFLEQINHMKELMFVHGDYDALIMIVDFESATDRCRLSMMEKRVLHLVYIEDLKRVDVAKQFNVTKQTVQKWVERAIGKLANYYKETGDYDAD